MMIALVHMIVRGMGSVESVGSIIVEGRVVPPVGISISKTMQKP
jgi:hypothetical protein